MVVLDVLDVLARNASNARSNLVRVGRGLAIRAPGMPPGTILTSCRSSLCAWRGDRGRRIWRVFAREKEFFLRGLLCLKHGVPSHDAFSRLFPTLDPDPFRDA
jgi:hypothetical protein